MALIATGVHAAADTVDDRILSVVDLLDAAWDSFFSRFTLTESWLGWVGLEERLFVARGLAFLWELAADLALAMPALGYRELPKVHGVRGTWERFVGMMGQTVKRPTTLRLVRPLATAAIALAGACAVARMAQAGFYSASHTVLPDGLAGSLARAVGIVVLVGVSFTLGARAVYRNLEHAHVASERKRLHPLDVPFTRGLWASVVVAPLALAALLDASPVLSFFR